MNWLKQIKQHFEVFECRGQILIHGDSREVLKFIPNEKFDLILTDPPYGIGFDFYDDSNAVFFEIEPELWRVTKPNSWFLFWWTIKNLPEAFKLKKFIYKHLIVVHFYASASKSFLGDRKFTPVLVYEKGNPKVNYRYTDILLAQEIPIIKGKVKKGDFKPTYTQTILIHMFSRKNSLILDPFAGYGSLPLVCSLWNRRCIAIEKNRTRFEIAKKILSEGEITVSIPELEKKYHQKYNQEDLFSI